MSRARMSGVLLIAAFVLVIAASVVGPSEVYSAPDAETRLAVIDANQGRWTATNLIWAAAGLVAALGMILLGVHLSTSQPAWLPYLAAAVCAIGFIAWAIYLVQRTSTPADFLYTMPPPTFALIFLWAVLAGLVLLGVAFLQGAFPNWTGYLLIGANVLVLAAVVFAFDSFYASFPPQFFWLLTLVVGIVALRR